MKVDRVSLLFMTLLGPNSPDGFRVVGESILNVSFVRNGKWSELVERDLCISEDDNRFLNLSELEVRVLNGKNYEKYTIDKIDFIKGISGILEVALDANKSKILTSFNLRLAPDFLCEIVFVEGKFTPKNF